MKYSSLMIITTRAKNKFEDNKHSNFVNESDRITNRLLIFN